MTASQSRPRVFVSVHGRFHAFELAAELDRHQMLAGISTTYPKFIARRFLPPGIPILTAPHLELMRRIHAKLPVALTRYFALDPWLATRFSRFSADNLPQDIDAVISWSGASKEIMAIAHRKGARVLLERGSTHISHQADVLRAAFEEFGIAEAPVPEAMIDRETVEYEMADAISVPTKFAAHTFLDRGIAKDKIFINPYGVELDRFLSVNNNEVSDIDRPIRILFVGRVDIRKGIPWLLRAFAPLAGRAELHLVGPVSSNMQPILERESLNRVIVHGPVPSTALADVYRSADVFCLPSLEEGFALVLLQAMAAGLPVVASTVSGGEELVKYGQEGYLIPPRNVEALTEALEILLRDKEARKAMGAAARQRVERGYTWRDYGNRAIRIIESVLGRSAS